MNENTFVEITTSIGIIIIKLYNDTPLHHDNFIKLAQEGTYNGTLFHRVIQGFMIQTGNPMLRAENFDSITDSTMYNYTLPAEIITPKYFHKKGAIAAARMNNDINPERVSSGTQFYIVTGKVFTDNDLEEMRADTYQALVENTYEQLRTNEMKNLYLLKKGGKIDDYNALQYSLRAEAQRIVAANPPQSFTPQQKNSYTTLGGTPHLDYEYTVFGEVVEGIDIVELIEKTPTRRERPIKEVYIQQVKILQ